MPIDPHRPMRVREWLEVLGMRCAPMKAENAEVKLADYPTGLADNRPRPEAALTVDTGLTDADQRILAVWQSEREIVKADRRMLASLAFMRSRFPAVFKHLCRSDLEVADIAVRKGWHEADTYDPQQGWGDAEAVQRAIRRIRAPMPDGTPMPMQKIYLNAIRSALEKWAPENLDLLSDDRATQ
jgi:hypothetical protein